MNDAEQDALAASPAAPESTTRLERAILGSLMLIHRDTVGRVLKILRPEDLVRESHRAIYESIASVWRIGADPDLVLVFADLDARGQLDRAGGAAYVAGCMDDLPCVENVVYYAKVARERAVMTKDRTRRAPR